MRSRTLTNLIADVRQRTNMENSELLTDTEIAEYLNQELAELHARLTMAEGQPHFRSFTPISVVTGTSLYPLPSDFFKLQRLITTLDGRTFDLEPFMEGERASLLNNQYFVSYASFPMYRLQADNIEILPVTRSFTATLYYTRAQQRLVAGSDTTDGFDGYEMAAIYGACATVAKKEDSDVSLFVDSKDRIYRTIAAAAASRDASHPERVMDVTGGLGAWWWVPLSAREQLDDDQLDRVQLRIQAIEMGQKKLPFFKGRLIEGQPLTTSPLTMTHGLGRKPRGMILVSVSPAASVGIAAAQPHDPTLFVDVVASASCTASLWFW